VPWATTARRFHGFRGADERADPGAHHEARRQAPRAWFCTLCAGDVEPAQDVVKDIEVSAGGASEGLVESGLRMASFERRCPG
jgi:hypothetical protein